MCACTGEALLARLFGISKHDLQAELDDSRVSFGRFDDAKAGRGDRAARRCEVRYIERVKELGAEFGQDPLGYRNAFVDRDVDVPLAGAAHGVSSDVAK